MRRQIAIGALLFVAASTEFCVAADPRYPDWPCTQAKVPEISLTAVWAGPPLDDIKGKWKDDAKVSALVPKLAARRTSLEDAQKAITEFLGGSAVDKATTGKLLFAGLFDSLNAQRSSVLSGLERITRKQREAADKIRSDVSALHALQGASPPDQLKIDELSNQMVWQTRIFEDRQRMVKFVCEVPTAIDQRLFALGRMIQQEIE
jgi:DNA polymerase III alpha subunit